MKKQEERMNEKLLMIDSFKAKKIFGNIEDHYNNFEKELRNDLSSNQYISSLDTLTTSLKFFQENLHLISHIQGIGDKLNAALANVNELEDAFRDADEIKTFINGRTQILKDQLSQFGFTGQLKKLNQRLYYYAEQINKYKETLRDHQKIEKKVIEWLTNTKLFREFMQKNSTLASLFRLPGDPSDPLARSNLAGLQTRAQVNNIIQQLTGVGGTDGIDQFRQNMQEAQSQLNELKSRLNEPWKKESVPDMPDGFKPNNQKTKTFLQRIEFGINIQSQKATNFFPVTSDIGLSMGYKLNDKSIIGVGVSYKLGWGQNWNHISFTNEGVGLRTYVDWRIKGGLWISGGYEQNYKRAFSESYLLRFNNAWQQSGLLGLSKVVPLKTKFFKKTKMQLLWDFLSYQQVPRSQSLVVRIGYTF